jgi:SAM-dependent methyltransferase
MALGSAHAAVATSAWSRAYRSRFGIEDFHTHVRWAAVRDWVDSDSELTLEVGCNTGVLTVEVARLIKGTLVASEFEEELLAVARAVVEASHLDNVELSQADLRELGETERFTQALLIDVLEHIDDDNLALRQLASALLPGGTLIVSVPTPRYPEVFGRPFHESIGHVRDGYWLAGLSSQLDAAGFDVRDHRYYTGPRASRACSLFYRRSLPTKALLPTLPALRSYSLRGEAQATEANAASLALIAVKRSPRS